MVAGQEHDFGQMDVLQTRYALIGNMRQGLL